jgi:hypothetical protein
VRLLLSIDQSDVEPLHVDLKQLLTTLSDEQRLTAAKALVAAAYMLCPKKDGGSYVDPAALDLATFLNSAVTSLLVTEADRRRASWWDAVREQHDGLAAQGLH